jgi:carbon storage regulator
MTIRAKEGWMLILTRKEGEGIRLGENIRIVLVQLKGNQVRLGIECPSTMRVLREELYQAVRDENLAAMSADPNQMGDLAKHSSSKDLKPSQKPFPGSSSS